MMHPSKWEEERPQTPSEIKLNPETNFLNNDRKEN
jgi:hypothetical protein